MTPQFKQLPNSVQNLLIITRAKSETVNDNFHVTFLSNFFALFFALTDKSGGFSDPPGGPGLSVGARLCV